VVSPKLEDAGRGDRRGLVTGGFHLPWFPL